MRFTDTIQPGPDGLGLDVRVTQTDRSSFLEIQSLLPGSSADQNGILQPGDLITAVNGDSMLGLPGAVVFNRLKQASGRGAVTIEVLREEHPSMSKSHLMDESTASKVVHLPVHPGGLGAQIAIEKGDVVIVGVNPNGSAHAAGLKEGFRLVSINGQKFSGKSFEDVVAMMAVARGQNGKSGRKTTTKKVTLPDSPQGHGLILEDVPSQDRSTASVVIKEIAPGSSAAQSGQLQPGQTIVAINGQSLQNHTSARAMTILTLSKFRSAGQASVEVASATDSPPSSTRRKSMGNQFELEYIPTRNNRPRSPASLSESSRVSRFAPHPAAPNVSMMDSTHRPRWGAEDHGGGQSDHNEQTLLQALKAEREIRAQTEKDYDEIVTLLEAEVAHLKAQLIASPNEVDRLLVQYRQRCVALGAQVNKSVTAKVVMDAAVAKLLEFTRRTKDLLVDTSKHPRTADPSLNLREDGTLRHLPSQRRPPPSSAWAVGSPCLAPNRLHNDEMRTAVIHAFEPHVSGAGNCLVRFQEGEGDTIQVARLADLRPLPKDVFAIASGGPGGGGEGDEEGDSNVPGAYLSDAEAKILAKADRLVTAVTEVLHFDALPFGWEEAFTSDGKRYYIDHVTQTTSWKHPATMIIDNVNMGNIHQPPSMI